MSQNPKEYHKPKTESQNTKQNHTTLNRITKHKPESQNTKQNYKPKTESQNLKQKIRNPGKFFFLESGILGFGIQNTDKRIQNPITIGLRNPISN